MAEAKRDQNSITTLLAVSNVDSVTPVVLWADPTTHRLLVSAVAGDLGDLTDVTLTTEAQGDILYYTGTAWVNLAPGTSGKFLKTQGAGANPTWDTVSAGAAGSDTQVQFNDGGSVLGGDAGIVYNKTTDALTVAGPVSGGVSSVFGTANSNWTVGEFDATGSGLGYVSMLSPVGSVLSNAGIIEADTLVLKGITGESSVGFKMADPTVVTSQAGFEYTWGTDIICINTAFKIYDVDTVGRAIDFTIGESDITTSPTFKLWGYLTNGTAPQYITHQIDDTDDYYHIAKGHANILGMKIDMPLIVDTSINGDYLTASEILITDASKNIVSAPVATYPSLTELSYVKGLTSAVQSQINAKAPIDSPTFTTAVTLPVALTGLIRADSGLVSVDTDVTDLVSAASGTAAGKVELAIASEIDTGTDTTRAIPVDQFVASKRNIRWLVFNLVEAATDCAIASNIAGDFVSPIAGTILQSDSSPFYLYATNSTAGTTGTMVVDISIGGTSIMTTNKLDIDTTEKTTTTAATPPDLTTTALAVGNIITIDIDSIHTTAAKGLTVYMAVRE